MRNMHVVLTALVVAVMSSQAYAQQAATKDEIMAAFVGHTGQIGSGDRVTYGADGQYSYTTYGKYVISDGQICVTFANGSQRCDSISKSGDTFILTNRNGQKYPLSFK